MCGVFLLVAKHNRQTTSAQQTGSHLGCETNLQAVTVEDSKNFGVIHRIFSISTLRIIATVIV